MGAKAVIRRELCVGCGACAAVCPAGAIRMMPGWYCRVDAERCIGCGNCAGLCHRKAPFLTEKTVAETSPYMV